MVAAHCCMNLFARYFGSHITEHFPCTYQCRATARLGDQLLRGLARFEPAFAAETEALLASPVVFAPGFGACLFPDATWDSDRKILRYTRVLASNPGSEFASRVVAASEWSIKDGGNVIVFPSLN